MASFTQLFFASAYLSPVESFQSLPLCEACIASVLNGLILVRVAQAISNWKWWYPVVIFGVTLTSAWARIFLGAHYPSDCLFSLPQAVLILTATGLMFYFEKYLCGSCAEAAVNVEQSCYVEEPNFNPWQAEVP